MRMKILLWIFVMCLLASISFAVPLNPNFYYSYDNNTNSSTNIYDNTSNGYNGVKIGVTAPSLTKNGFSSNAVFFDGVNDRITLTNPSINSSGYSICTWVNAENDDLNERIVEKYTTLTNRAFLLGKVDADDGYFRFGYHNGATFIFSRFNDTDFINKWTYICGVYNGTQPLLYLDGVLVGTPSGSGTSQTGIADFVIGEDDDGTADFGGIIDETGFWNRSLSQTEITELFNFYTPLIINSPVNNTVNNVPLVANFSWTGNDGVDCELVVNGSVVNQTVTIPSSFNFLEYVNMTDGIWEWLISCDNNSFNSSSLIYIMDTVDPNISISNPVNGSEFTENFNLNISISDPNNFLAEVNITASNGTSIFSQSYNTSGTNVFNITNSINHTFASFYNMVVLAADGHTKNEIDVLQHSIFNKEINFNPGNDEVRIYPVKKSDFKSLSTKKLEDRYNFGFERSNNRVDLYDEFIVEGGDRINLVNSEYEGHLIVERGSNVKDWYWVDFETVENYEVDVFKISVNKVLVRVFGNSNKDYVFNSLGQLNVVTQNVTYFFDSSNVSFVESFESFIVSDFNTTLFLNVTFNRLKYNSSLAVPNASLVWNGTVFSGNLISFNITDASFSVNVMPSLSSGIVNITHNWSFNIRNVTNVTNNFVSDNQNQTLFSIVVAPCNASIPYPVVNFSYFDEVTGSPITLDNGFALAIFDGTFFYNQTGNFSGSTSDALCTNLPPSNITYNWNMWGTLTLQKAGYVTRIFTIPELSPLAISNNPMTQQDLFLITLNESSTVTFNWFTTEFQPIDGTMLIYKCNINGSRSLVESVPIVSSQAVANIQLITQPYSYEVIIDGVTLAQDSFTTCHIEASNSVTFYVDVIQSNLVPVIGMFLVDCSMEKLSNTTVRMSWNSNPFESDEDIIGCLLGFRETLGGLVQIYENCTSGASNSITRTIPDNPFSYVVKGELTQGDNLGFCQNEVSFIREATSAELFGIVGLLCAFFLVVSMALFFAEDGESHVISGGVGFFIAWIFGILAFDWKIVSAIFVFLGFIVVAGRYTRK